MIDEDLAHEIGSQCDEVAPVLHLRRTLVDQPHVGLVNERSGLQGMARALPPQMALRDSVQLLVYKRQETLQGSVISGSP
jgi:hypothetical protein